MNCRVCGRQFDPTGFQVMVPGVKHGFDRVDCALEASLLARSSARTEVPPVPVMRALPPAVPALAGAPVAMAGAATARPQLLAGVNLTLLAAGAAATIYLWLRVFGADAGPFAFSAGSAAPAFERTSVAAVVDLTPAPAARPLPESSVRGGGSQLAAPAPVIAVSANSTLASDRKPAKKNNARRNGGPVVRPTAPPSPPPAPPAEPTPTRAAPTPTIPVPSSPPPNRIPGPTIPGGGGGTSPPLPSGGSRG